MHGILIGVKQHGKYIGIRPMVTPYGHNFTPQQQTHPGQWDASDFSFQATYPYQGVNFLNQHFPLASYLDSTTLFKVLALL